MAKEGDIYKRTFDYSLRAIKLYQFLSKQNDRAGWVIGDQYPRSAISIGANIEEARAGESRKDFIHKLGIAQKKARESLYWLKLLAEAKLIDGTKLNALTKETEEIYAIITSIIVHSKRRTK